MAFSGRSSTVSDEPSIDTGRLARTLTLIAFVTAGFLMLSAARLGEDLFRIAVVGVGTVALITAIVAFLIAAGSAYEQSGRR